MECPNTTKHAEETFGQVFGNAPPHSFNERTPVLVMVMDISHQGSAFTTRLRIIHDVC
jgi:hypothetical protein